MLFLLAACTPNEPPPTLPEPDVLRPLPVGAFEVAFNFPYRVNGTPWEVTPAGSVVRTEDDIHVDLREVWREDSPFFPHCPVQLQLDGPHAPGDLAIYEVVSSEVEDPCAIEPYAADEPFVLRFVTTTTAFGWLADALSMNRAVLDAGQAELEQDLGPATDWFAFWGPAEDQLWPLGHVFAAPP